MYTESDTMHSNVCVHMTDIHSSFHVVSLARPMLAFLFRGLTVTGKGKRAWVWLARLASMQVCTVLGTWHLTSTKYTLPSKLDSSSCPLESTFNFSFLTTASSFLTRSLALRSSSFLWRAYDPPNRTFSHLPSIP